MDADQSAFGRQCLQHRIGQANSADGADDVVAGDHRRAARLDQLQVHGLRAMRDVDQDAELVHPPHQRASALIDAVVVIRRLPALCGGERTVGEGIEPALGCELDAAQAEPIKGRQHVRIAFMIETRFDAEKNRHAPAGNDGTRLGNRARHAHLIRVRFGEAMKGFDQSQRLLGTAMHDSLTGARQHAGKRSAVRLNITSRLDVAVTTRV